jgi:hypothetical protein
MPAGPVLHIFCCRTVTVPYRPEWEGLLRDAMLARLRCSVCGKRPIDVQRGWALPTLEECGKP